MPMASIFGIVGILTVASISASGASYATKVYWENKYQTLENNILKATVKANDERAQAFTLAVDNLAQITQEKESEALKANQKYRNLYASYSKLQQQTPTPVGCDIPNDRAIMLVYAGQQASEARSRLIENRAEITNSFNTPASVPITLPGRIGNDPTR